MTHRPLSGRGSTHLARVVRSEWEGLVFKEQVSVVSDRCNLTQKSRGELGLGVLSSCGACPNYAVRTTLAHFIREHTNLIVPRKTTAHTSTGRLFFWLREELPR